MTTVDLRNNETIKAFPIESAQALLDYEKQIKVKNWELDDKNFELTDGTIKRKNNRPDKKSKEQEMDTVSDTPSE